MASVTPVPQTPQQAGKVAFTVLDQQDGRRYRIVLREGDLARLRVDKIKSHLARSCGVPVEEQVRTAWRWGVMC